jgi:hypothetical protein
VITGAGLRDVELGPAVDAFAGAHGEAKARQFGTYGYPIRASKPVASRSEIGLPNSSDGERTKVRWNAQ